MDGYCGDCHYLDKEELVVQCHKYGDRLIGDLMADGRFEIKKSARCIVEGMSQTGVGRTWRELALSIPEGELCLDCELVDLHRSIHTGNQTHRCKVFGEALPWIPVISTIPDTKAAGKCQACKDFCESVLYVKENQDGEA